MIVRPGRPGDASAIARLIDLAGDGLPMLLWGAMGATSGSGALHTGRRLVESRDGPCSHRHAWVAVIRGQIAAAVLGDTVQGDLSPPRPFDPPIVRTLLDLQGLARRTYMISNLATFPAFRRQGCATALLHRTQILARAAGVPAISLIVATANEQAVHFYLHHGFREEARRPIPPFPGFQRTGDWSFLARPVEAV